MSRTTSELAVLTPSRSMLPSPLLCKMFRRVSNSLVTRENMSPKCIYWCWSPCLQVTVNRALWLCQRVEEWLWGSVQIHPRSQHPPLLLEGDRKLFFFWGYYFTIYLFGHATWGILVHWPGIKPTPPAGTAWSFNHWTIREVSPRQKALMLFHEAPREAAASSLWLPGALLQESISH